MRVWAALLLCVACQENAGSIVFKPTYVPPLVPFTPVCSGDPRRPVKLHVNVTADGNTFDQTIAFSNDVVQFDIPIGTMRTITMDLLNPQNCKLYTGSRSDVSFAEGDNGTLVVTMRPPTTSAYVDMDHDGLTLCVENALGTKDTSVDSDGDGFSDFCEVTGAAGGACTNPADPRSHPPGNPSRCNPDGGTDGGP
jgi:hypothetical protein